MQYIGQLDKNKLGKYKDKIKTFDVIITSERIEHINKRHPGDYEKYISYLSNCIKNPDYILEDKENRDTIIILKRIESKRIHIVIKLQTNNRDINKYNSIITYWQIRERSYKSTIKNNKIIYENLDKYE